MHAHDHVLDAAVKERDRHARIQGVVVTEAHVLARFDEEVADGAARPDVAEHTGVRPLDGFARDGDGMTLSVKGTREGTVGSTYRDDGGITDDDICLQPKHRALVAVILDILGELGKVGGGLDTQLDEGQSNAAVYRIGIGDHADIVVVAIADEGAYPREVCRIEARLLGDILIPTVIERAKALDGFIAHGKLGRLSREISLAEVAEFAFARIYLRGGHTVAEHTELVDAELRGGHIAHHAVLAIEHADPHVPHVRRIRRLLADDLARAPLIRLIGQIDGKVDEDILDDALVIAHERADDVAVYATYRSALLHDKDETLYHAVGGGVAEETRVLLAADRGVLLHRYGIKSAVKDGVEGMILRADGAQDFARVHHDIAVQTEEDVVIVGMAVYLGREGVEGGVIGDEKVVVADVIGHVGFHAVRHVHRAIGHGLEVAFILRPSRDVGIPVFDTRYRRGKAEAPHSLVQTNAQKRFVEHSDDVESRLLDVRTHHLAEGAIAYLHPGIGGARSSGIACRETDIRAVHVLVEGNCGIRDSPDILADDAARIDGAFLAHRAAESNYHAVDIALVESRHAARDIRMDG